MIKRWTIDNFKSFRNRTEIELAPITVFAGANSSGKSSIIQSILLLKQTVQYAPVTRALALNGPLVKLGAFNDVKNAASIQRFIGIGWEFTLDQSENIVSRSDLFSSGFYPSAHWGRSSLQSVTGTFRWETQSTEDGHLPDALLQLQPKLTLSTVKASIPSKNATELRDVSISQTFGPPIGSSADLQFNYQIRSIDELSRREMMESRPDGQIVAVAARHFFPGRLLVRYDAVKERAFRIANLLCVGTSALAYRQPQVNTIAVPRPVLELFRQHLSSKLGGQLDFSFLNPDVETPLTVDRFADWLLHTRGRLGQRAPLLEIRDQVEQLLFDSFAKDQDVERNALELATPRFLLEACEYVSSYFISAVRYLGPLRDEPKAIYPLEALVNPTDVGYRGEHTAAVLDLHRDTQVSYVPSTFIDDINNINPVRATLHDAVVDWLDYVGVASEIRTSDAGKFGHSILAAIMHDAAHFFDLSSERAVAIRSAGSV